MWRLAEKKKEAISGVRIEIAQVGTQIRFPDTNWPKRPDKIWGNFEILGTGSKGIFRGPYLGPSFIELSVLGSNNRTRKCGTPPYLSHLRHDDLAISHRLIYTKTIDILEVL